MIRFPTEAANADVMGEDTPAAQEPAGAPAAPPDSGARGGTDRPEHRRGRPRGKGAGAAKPGQDINAPGFIKDQDAGKPS